MTKIAEVRSEMLPNRPWRLTVHLDQSCRREKSSGQTTTWEVGLNEIVLARKRCWGPVVGAAQDDILLQLQLDQVCRMVRISELSGCQRCVE